MFKKQRFYSFIDKYELSNNYVSNTILDTRQKKEEELQPQPSSTDVNEVIMRQFIYIQYQRSSDTQKPRRNWFIVSLTRQPVLF